jgi:hypothetical protein
VEFFIWLTLAPSNITTTVICQFLSQQKPCQSQLKGASEKSLEAKGRQEKGKVGLYLLAWPRQGEREYMREQNPNMLRASGGGEQSESERDSGHAVTMTRGGRCPKRKRILLSGI